MKTRHPLACSKEEPEVSESDLGDELINSTIEELSSFYKSLNVFYRRRNALLRSKDITNFINRALEIKIIYIRKVVNCDNMELAFINKFETSF